MKKNIFLFGLVSVILISFSLLAEIEKIYSDCPTVDLQADAAQFPGYIALDRRFKSPSHYLDYDPQTFPLEEYKQILRDKECLAYEDIETALKHAEKVHKLSFSNREIAELPKEILQLPNIKTLIAWSTKVRSVPEWIYDIKSLEELQVSRSYALVLPDGISRLTNLTALKIQENGLTLTELPTDLVGLTNLKTLYIYSNKLTGFPPQVLLLKKLEDLDISHNPIQVLPEEIINLTFLKRLAIADCGLKELPAKIGELKNLESLSIGRNQLKDLPESIAHLKKLKEFIVSRKDRDAQKNISIFPKQLLTLSSLEFIDLSDTNITDIPLEILDLPSLKKMYLPKSFIGEASKFFKEKARLKNIYAY